MTLFHAALIALAVTLALALPVWLASLKLTDASLADRWWALWIAAPSCVYAAVLGPPIGIGGRGFWMLVVLAVWGVRLAWHVTRRNWGHGEDKRYTAMRKRNAPYFGWKSVYIVFGLQAVIAWVVASPFAAASALSSPAEPPWTWLDTLGLLVVAGGIAIESIGDAQLKRFKADPASKGQVMDRGVWRWSRHPNYFGESCVWWGLWLMALGAAGLGAVWSVVSPLAMTWLLLKVSGVAMLEQDIAERRPAYRNYIHCTSVFIPWPPRDGGADRSS